MTVQEQDATGDYEAEYSDPLEAHHQQPQEVHSPLLVASALQEGTSSSLGARAAAGAALQQESAAEAQEDVDKANVMAKAEIARMFGRDDPAGDSVIRSPCAAFNTKPIDSYSGGLTTPVPMTTPPLAPALKEEEDIPKDDDDDDGDVQEQQLLKKQKSKKKKKKTSKTKPGGPAGGNSSAPNSNVIIAASSSQSADSLLGEDGNDGSSEPSDDNSGYDISGDHGSLLTSNSATTQYGTSGDHGSMEDFSDDSTDYGNIARIVADAAPSGSKTSKDDPDTGESPIEKKAEAWLDSNNPVG